MPTRPDREEVSFSNGDISLAGTILLPAGDGPFPGVVIVHGSGASPRSNPWTRAYAEGLSRRGVAVLHPDKRGSGRSGGDWRRASFLDLADDSIAAVELLRKHAKLDPNNVGVIGFSQGGHVVPAAAARSKSVAYVVSVSASVVPIIEQIEDELTLMAEREGLSAEQTATIRRIHALGVQYAQGTTAWDQYFAALQQAKSGAPSGNKLVEGFPAEPDSPTWDFARSVGSYDPMLYWRQLSVPVMFVYGGKDANVRVSKSVGRIQEVFAPLDLNYVLMVFSENGHGLYREDELDFLATWIKDKGKA